ncbi:MAG: hypothetical protein MJA27_19615 [Pseudanabaenales cyanobacterium]|nr:hypothetical protein [Pseudanabaenales cyanobacterium]
MNGFQDAFISYGRIDSKAFAAKLNDRLIARDWRSAAGSSKMTVSMVVSTARGNPLSRGVY